MNIFLRGYYGGRNVGDDALLWVMVRELDRLIPGASVRVTPGIESAVPQHSLQIVRPPKGRFGPRLAAARSDLMLYGGGGVIQEYSARGGILSNHLQLSRVARLCGTPRVYLGVSVGPLEAPRAAERTRAIVRQATLMTVRDRASLRLLEEIGAEGPVQVTQDLALLLDEVPLPPRHRPERPMLGVSTNAFFQAVYRDAERDRAVHGVIAEVLNALMAAHPDLLVKFLCFHRGLRQDLWAAQHVRTALRHPERTLIFPYADDPRETLAEVATCDFLLTFRLHAAIFAYLAGVPMLALDYHPKVAGFAEMIALPDETRLPLAELSAPVLHERLTALVAGELPQAQVPVAESVAAARRNFELLAEVLGR